MDPDEIQQWAFRLSVQASETVERSGIDPAVENIPYIISQIPQELQPVLVECKSDAHWFVPRQRKSPLTAEHVAGIMTVIYHEDYEWRICGLGVGPQAGGVFLTGKVTPHDKVKIDRGIFPPTLKVWGRAGEGLWNLPPDTPMCQNIPGHNDYYRDLVLQNTTPPASNPEATIDQWQEHEVEGRPPRNRASGWNSVEDWLDCVDDKPGDDHDALPTATTAGPTDCNDTAGALPSYDQATAGRPDRQRRDSMVKNARCNQF